jgi:hypothetical protein
MQILIVSPDRKKNGNGQVQIAIKIKLLHAQNIYSVFFCSYVSRNFWTAHIWGKNQWPGLVVCWMSGGVGGSCKWLPYRLSLRCSSFIYHPFQLLRMNCRVSIIFKPPIPCNWRKLSSFLTKRRLSLKFRQKFSPRHSSISLTSLCAPPPPLYALLSTF